MTVGTFVALSTSRVGFGDGSKGRDESKGADDAARDLNKLLPDARGALSAVAVSMTGRNVVEELACYRCEEVDTVGRAYPTPRVLGNRFTCTQKDRERERLQKH